MLGLSLSQHQHQRLSLENRLTLVQRNVIVDLVTQIRWNLIQTLYEERYDAHSDCPTCFHKMKPREILEGFSDSPTDIRTRCPKCKTHFETHLIAYTRSGSTQVKFYCPIQTLYALIGKEHATPEEISHALPGIYQSALLHFGSLRNAFKESGKQVQNREIRYAHADLEGWEAKVTLFLGQLPDPVIAQIVGQKTTVIRRMRQKAGIKAFSKRNLLAEA